MKNKFYHLVFKLFFLSKQFCMCNLHRSIHNRRINLCVKALLDIGSNLQIMHCNTCNFNKSTSHPLLTRTNPQHLDIPLWSMQVATCAFIGASCEASTFDIVNKTTFFFNDWTQKNLNTKNKDIRQTFQNLFKLSKTKKTKWYKTYLCYKKMSIHLTAMLE